MSRASFLLLHFVGFLLSTGAASSVAALTPCVSPGQYVGIYPGQDNVCVVTIPPGRGHTLENCTDREMSYYLNFTANSSSIDIINCTMHQLMFFHNSEFHWWKDPVVLEDIEIKVQSSASEALNQHQSRAVMSSISFESVTLLHSTVSLESVQMLQQNYSYWKWNSTTKGWNCNVCFNNSLLDHVNFTISRGSNLTAVKGGISNIISVETSFRNGRFGVYGGRVPHSAWDDKDVARTEESNDAMVTVLSSSDGPNGAYLISFWESPQQYAKQEPLMQNQLFEVRDNVQMTTVCDKSNTRTCNFLTIHANNNAPTPNVDNSSIVFHNNVTVLVHSTITGKTSARGMYFWHANFANGSQLVWSKSKMEVVTHYTGTVSDRPTAVESWGLHVSTDSAWKILNSNITVAVRSATNSKCILFYIEVSRIGGGSSSVLVQNSTLIASNPSQTTNGWGTGIMYHSAIGPVSSHSIAFENSRLGAIGGSRVFLIELYSTFQEGSEVRFSHGTRANLTALHNGGNARAIYSWKGVLDASKIIFDGTDCTITSLGSDMSASTSAYLMWLQSMAIRNGSEIVVTNRANIQLHSFYTNAFELDFYSADQSFFDGAKILITNHSTIAVNAYGKSSYTYATIFYFWYQPDTESSPATIRSTLLEVSNHAVLNVTARGTHLTGASALYISIMALDGSKKYLAMEDFDVLFHDSASLIVTEEPLESAPANPQKATSYLVWYSKSSFENSSLTFRNLKSMTVTGPDYAVGIWGDTFYSRMVNTQIVIANCFADFFSSANQALLIEENKDSNSYVGPYGEFRNNSILVERMRLQIVSNRREVYLYYSNVYQIGWNFTVRDINFFLKGYFVKWQCELFELRGTFQESVITAHNMTGTMQGHAVNTYGVFLNHATFDQTSLTVDGFTADMSGGGTSAQIAFVRVTKSTITNGSLLSFSNIDLPWFSCNSSRALCPANVFLVDGGSSFSNASTLTLRNVAVPDNSDYLRRNASSPALEDRMFTGRATLLSILGHSTFTNGSGVAMEHVSFARTQSNAPSGGANSMNISVVEVTQGSHFSHNSFLNLKNNVKLFLEAEPLFREGDEEEEEEAISRTKLYLFRIENSDFTDSSALSITNSVWNGTGFYRCAGLWISGSTFSSDSGVALFNSHVYNHAGRSHAVVPAVYNLWLNEANFSSDAFFTINASTLWSNNNFYTAARFNSKGAKLDSYIYMSNVVAAKTFFTDKSILRVSNDSLLIAFYGGTQYQENAYYYPHNLNLRNGGFLHDSVIDIDGVKALGFSSGRHNINANSTLYADSLWSGMVFLKLEKVLFRWRSGVHLTDADMKLGGDPSSLPQATGAWGSRLSALPIPMPVPPPILANQNVDEDSDVMVVSGNKFLENSFLNLHDFSLHYRSYVAGGMEIVVSWTSNLYEDSSVFIRNVTMDVYSAGATSAADFYDANEVQKNFTVLVDNCSFVLSNHKGDTGWALAVYFAATAFVNSSITFSNSIAITESASNNQWTASTLEINHANTGNHDNSFNLTVANITAVATALGKAKVFNFGIRQSFYDVKNSHPFHMRGSAGKKSFFMFDNITATVVGASRNVNISHFRFEHWNLTTTSEGEQPLLFSVSNARLAARYTNDSVVEGASPVPSAAVISTSDVHFGSVGDEDPLRSTPLFLFADVSSSVQGGSFFSMEQTSVGSSGTISSSSTHQRPPAVIRIEDVEISFAPLPVPPGTSNSINTAALAASSSVATLFNTSVRAPILVRNVRFVCAALSGRVTLPPSSSSLGASGTCGLVSVAASLFSGNGIISFELVEGRVSGAALFAAVSLRAVNASFFDNLITANTAFLDEAHAHQSKASGLVMNNVSVRGMKTSSVVVASNYVDSLTGFTPANQSRVGTIAFDSCNFASFARFMNASATTMLVAQEALTEQQKQSSIEQFNISCTTINNKAVTESYLGADTGHQLSSAALALIGYPLSFQEQQRACQPISTTNSPSGSLSKRTASATLSRGSATATHTHSHSAPTATPSHSQDRGPGPLQIVHQPKGQDSGSLVKQHGEAEIHRRVSDGSHAFPGVPVVLEHQRLQHNRRQSKDEHNKHEVGRDKPGRRRADGKGTEEENSLLHCVAVAFGGARDEPEGGELLCIHHDCRAASGTAQGTGGGHHGGRSSSKLHHPGSWGGHLQLY